MKRIEGHPREIVGYDGNGVMLAVVDLQVSTRAELPAEGEIVGELIPQPGSRAQIIREGTQVTMDADFAWYPKSAADRPLLGDVPNVF